MTSYVPSACRRCGRRVVFVNAVASDGQTVKVPLDVAASVWVRQPDGEGGAVWAQDTTGHLMASHHALCGRNGGAGAIGGES